MFKFGARSFNKLKGVHPDLVAVMTAAIKTSPYDFGITSGLRTLDEQKLLLKMGKSRTLKSRHLTGHAVDIIVYVDKKPTWEFKYYTQVANHIKKIAKSLDIPIQWGGEIWAKYSYYDGPHFQLPVGDRYGR